MADYIPDPDFEGFDGSFLDNRIIDPPPNEYDLSAIAEYMKKNHKSFEQLTEKEKAKFKIY